MDPAFRYATRMYSHGKRMRSMTIAAAFCYLIGYTLIGIALFVAASELPHPYGRCIAVAFIGYIIVTIGEWSDGP